MGISEAWAGLQALMEIMKHQESIRTRFRKSINYLKGGNQKIYVFGAGGVGKTTLKLTLLSDFDALEDAGYKDTAIAEEGILPNSEVWSKIVVAPGQEDRRQKVWPTLYEQIRAGEAAGIIHVASYGYHSLRKGRSLKSTGHWQRLPEGERTQEAFLNAYLQSQRDHECEIWEELTGVAADAPNNPWLMTLVTKQDLWSNLDDEVRSFYRDGSYSTSVRDIERRKGKENVRNEVAFASFIIQNFLGPEGEVLAETVGGFDQRKQLDSITRLSTLIDELIRP